MLSKKDMKRGVIALLNNIYDPEIPVSIYALGLIYDISFSEVEYGYSCVITMTLTSPSCPVADSLLDQVYNISYMIEEIQKMRVDVVFEPPWNSSMMSEEARLELDL
ncbi:MAG: FeS assembly SUF system protein [Sulfurimonas sp.]|nr:MAG: FeS assembly SUF system protein [Sulfurimonas sp.]